MNIINNSIFIDSFKSNTIQSNNNIISNNTAISDIENIEKTTNSDNALNTKSDTYLTSKLPLNNANDLISYAKKLLFNESFREIAINSDPKLREAYENFTKAISTDDSKLAEYIKSVLSDSNKFSGEFFNALNKLMTDTNDISLKNAIYDFLKIFDYYFSQNENASAVNSSLNELLNKLPEDIRNYLLNILSSSFDNNMNLILLSIFDTRLPENEKLKLFISYLLDFTESNNDDVNKPLDILKSNNENMSFINSALKTIKESSLVFDDEIKALLERLEEKLNSQNTNTSDNYMSEHSLSMQKSNINLLIKLIQNVNKENSIVSTDITVDNNEIIKFFNNLKATANFDNKSLLNSIINDLEKFELRNSSELLTIFNKIKDYILNKSYPKDVKENILNLFNKFTNSILEKLIYSDVSKNKCELLLNIYEKNIMPNLLKNTEQSTLSNLTHNLLRLKLGTADEFNNQIKTFFNKLAYNSLVNSEEAINMKLSLINKLVEQHNINDGMKAFLEFVDRGIKLSTNEQNKVTFENTLLSLISKEDMLAKYKHFFLPLVYNGQHVLSEILLGMDRIKEKNKKRKSSESDDLVFKITLILDIKNKGVFNTTIVYSNGEVSANVEVPEQLSSASIKIYNDIKNIIVKNNLKANSIIVN